MNRRRYALIVFVASLVSLFLVLGMRESMNAERAKNQQHELVAVEPAAQSLDVLGSVTDFELLNARGGTTQLEDLRGQVWVADFMFTSCQGTCPMLTEGMRSLQQALEDIDGVQFVSISVDPGTDTPERLASYASENGADVPNWHFLTGEPEAIQTLAVKGFMVGSMDEPLFHSNRFVLVDDLGQIRGYYEGTDPDAIARLRDDILTLRSE